MEIISKIFKIICNFLTIIMLIILMISVYSWIEINIYKNNYSSTFGYSLFEVVTGSMSGSIEIDDYILVKKINDYKLNDIVTFTQNNAIITHRIIEIKGDKIITRGDANNTSDVEITKNDIIGKVVYTIPKAGIWKKVLSNNSVLVSILITLVLFTIFFSMEEKKYRIKRIHANFNAIDNRNGVKVVKANLDNIK